MRNRILWPTYFLNWATRLFIIYLKKQICGKVDCRIKLNKK